VVLRSEVQRVALELGLRVRAARVRRRWTAQDLADKLDVSERTVRKLEKGEISVALGTALAACVLLDVDFEAELNRHVARKRARPRAPEISASETDF
jgi:transcriptional regulator with XRE-family HTH domain